MIKTRNCARRPNWWYRTKYVKCHRRGVQSGDGSLALAQSGPRLRRRGQVRPRGTRDGVSAAAPRRRGAADVLEQRGAFPSPVVRRRTPRGGAAPASGTTRPAVRIAKSHDRPAGRPVRRRLRLPPASGSPQTLTPCAPHLTSRAHTRASLPAKALCCVDAASDHARRRTRAGPSPPRARFARRRRDLSSSGREAVPPGSRAHAAPV